MLTDQRTAPRFDEMPAGAGTLLLVSHRLAEIEARCTRAIWLEQGVLRMDGPVAEVLGADDI